MSFRSSRLGGTSRREFAFTTLLALLLAMTVAVAPRTVAQDTDSTEGHPLVGTWIVSADGETSLIALHADGVVVDVEAAGDVGLGSWAAASSTSANVTFGFFIDFHGSPAAVVIRATLDYDESSDSVSGTYSVTGQTLDGSVVFADSGTAEGTRFPAEGADMGGTAIPALSSGSAATPAS